MSKHVLSARLFRFSVGKKYHFGIWGIRAMEIWSYESIGGRAILAARTRTMQSYKSITIETNQKQRYSKLDRKSEG
jgi:hypothetical protein